MSISSWEDPMRHFQTQNRWTILHVLMVASVQLTCPCPGASQQITSNSSKYTINPRAHHIVPTRTIVANTQHQHNEVNAEARRNTTSWRKAEPLAGTVLHWSHDQWSLMTTHVLPQQCLV